MALVHSKLKQIDNKSKQTWEEHFLGSLEMNVRTDLGRDGRTQGNVTNSRRQKIIKIFKLWGILGG